MSEKPQALRDDWKNQSLRMAEREIRNAIIEECARVAELSVLGFRFPDVCEEIADAIRALKDKPCLKN